MNIVDSMVLPGGWHYKDSSGYRIPLTSELPNPKEVVAAILQYRLENHLPIGDPEGDFVRYICANFPPWCRQSPATPTPAKVQPNRRNVDLIIQWANQLYTQIGRLNLVTQREAEERGAICAQCPKQMEWARDCPPCVTSAQRLLSILRQGKDSTGAQSGALKGCSLYHWDNATAIHLDPTHLAPIHPECPTNCWRRK